MATASKKRTVKQKEPVTYEEFRAITDLTQQPFPAEGGGQFCLQKQHTFRRLSVKVACHVQEMRPFEAWQVRHWNTVQVFCVRSEESAIEHGGGTC
jgi:hypothetical protein